VCFGDDLCSFFVEQLCWFCAFFFLWFTEDASVGELEFFGACACRRRKDFLRSFVGRGS